MIEAGDFVISEEQLKEIRGMIFHEDEVKFEKLSWKIISCPLSEALKQERERVLDLIKKWGIENETFVDYGYYDGLLFLSDLHKYIESLRSEP